MSSPPVSDVTPRRADARRNRERVLEAAGELFAEHGLDAQMPDIARHAGVGVGTVYRHFATKEALVQALAERHFAGLVRLAEETLAAGGDPWAAFEGVMRRAARLLVEDRGLAEIAANQPDVMAAAAAHQERLHALGGELVARAVAAGSMRADATGDDIPIVMCGLGKIATQQRCGRPVSWERYLTLMLDGLRTAPSSP